MQAKTVFQSMADAMSAFRMAENELNRPNEDAVTICACHSMRNSVNYFLHSFLLSNPEKLVNDPAGDLLSQCVACDSRFNAIDLSCFRCEIECTEDYCLSVEKVGECFNQANAVKKLVMEKLQLSEKDFE